MAPTFPGSVVRSSTPITTSSAVAAAVARERPRVAVPSRATMHKDTRGFVRRRRSSSLINRHGRRWRATEVGRHVAFAAGPPAFVAERTRGRDRRGNGKPSGEIGQRTCNLYPCDGGHGWQGTYGAML